MDDANGSADIVHKLKKCMFKSKAVVEIDSIIARSLFGQRERKEGKRWHEMQTLSNHCVVDDETRKKIYATFEKGKESLVFSDSAGYFDTVGKMANHLYRSASLIKVHGGESKNIVEWCIAAYSMVINPESSVKLSCVEMGPLQQLGFTVHAVRAIKQGETIHELIGLMPKDNRAKHSGLSTIKPHSDQNQSPGVERILFGPIRFINHICQTPNTEFIAFKDTSCFCVCATRDINPNEELFLDYGKEWFAEEEGGCPCITCNPDQQPEKKKQRTEEKDKAIKDAEKRECMKKKRKRQKERKRMAKNKRGEGAEEA